MKEGNNSNSFVRIRLNFPTPYISNSNNLFKVVDKIKLKTPAIMNNNKVIISNISVYYPSPRDCYRIEIY